MAQRCKQQKITENKDWISALPNCILNKIISKLPTKMAVQTCVLSRRWVDQWKDLTDLHFDDLAFFKENKDYNSCYLLFAKPPMFDSQKRKQFLTFISFVNSFLAKRNVPTRKMKLVCIQSHLDDPFLNSAFDTTVPSVFGPSLQELDVQLVSIGGYSFAFPIASISRQCKNLVALSLAGSITIDKNLVEAIDLPCLEKLSLRIGSLKAEDLNKIFARCPSLEDVEIYTPRELISTLNKPYNAKILKMNIDNEVNCQYMVLKCDDVGHHSFQHLRKARVDIFYHSYMKSMRKPLSYLLDNLSGIEVLCLSAEATMGLLVGFGELHKKNFVRLRHLDINLPHFNSYFLLNLLETCNFLEVLIIQNIKDQPPTPLEVWNLWGMRPTIPNCLRSSLISIQIKGYKGTAQELSFAEYLLKKGLVLETFAILDILKPELKVDTLNRLSKISMASPTCKLTFE